MSVIILLILASLAVGLLFLGAFVWSVRSGQYEDTLTPSLRVLMDDTSSGPGVPPGRCRPPSETPAAPVAAAVPAAAPEIDKH